MTQHERELEKLQGAASYLPRCIKETKARGRKLRTAKKKVRKARAVVEFCRVECQKLPKDWETYRRKPTKTPSWTRPEVTAMHNALDKLGFLSDDLQGAQEKYSERHADRAQYRKELRALPDQIACLQSLIEIAAKKKKSAKCKNALARWIEVVPGYAVEKAKIAAYCKTLTQEPTKNISGGFYVLSHGSGYAKFVMQPLSLVA